MLTTIFDLATHGRKRLLSALGGIVLKIIRRNRHALPRDVLWHGSNGPGPLPKLGPRLVLDLHMLLY
ncbi:hypothetical protein TNCV_4617021 [Trichonephila clavipes]|nr:hypothetical protein TNCV_4617021 [Trichonephila clavipes]